MEPSRWRATRSMWQLLLFGGTNRAREHPLIPLGAAAKAAAEPAVAARSLPYEMPIVEKAWCRYCITDALTHLGTFLLTLPEAGQALSRLRQG